MPDQRTVSIGKKPDVLDTAIAALHGADDVAKRLRSKPREYQIVYYAKPGFSTSRSMDEAERRAAFDAMIDSLDVRDRLQSASTWIVRLHIKNAYEIVQHCMTILDPALDVVVVSEVTENRDQRAGR